MNLDDLNYFLAVAKSGLLHRAADMVGVSQPALTEAVKRLEHELGVALFARSPKGMQLARYGEAFQRHATTLLASYEDALGQIAEMFAGELAKVRIGATPATEPLVARAFLSLLKKRPALRLDLNVQLSDALIRELLEGDIDIAVAPMPVEMPDELRAVKLISETTSIVCRKDHPLVELGPEIGAHDLGRFPWILPGAAVSARQQIEAYFRRHCVEGPRIQVQSNYSSPMGVFYLVANTDMLSICNTRHRPEADRLGLQVINAARARWPRQIACLVRQAGTLSPLTAAFMEQIVSEANM